MDGNDGVATEGMLVNLAAPGPDPGERDELTLFGQFAGAWDLEMTSFGSDGQAEHFVAEWHFGWILQGRAVQDVLVTRTPTGELVGYGSTVRSYDPRRRLWWVVWQDPVAGEFAVLLARPDGDRIVLEGQWTIGQVETGALDPDLGARFRWTFSGIGPETFHWEAHVSRDGGRSWRLGEQMDARRRPAMS